MLSHESLSTLKKDEAGTVAEALGADDLKQLVGWLSEKNDTIRYNSFLLLQYRSKRYNDVYPYWNMFCEKLKSGNSYQRSIGLMLIAANARWDKDNRFDDVVGEYLELLQDEKPITVRQCIQSLAEIVPYKKHLLAIISDRLMNVDIDGIKETMRKVVLIDILTVLAMIRKEKTNDSIESYIAGALRGGVLDRKAARQIEAML